jgi:hypothetical protein
MLISMEVKNAEEYHQAVDPFISTHGSGGMLKFTVTDINKRKAPGLFTQPGLLLLPREFEN